jgi:hypothetical protein
MVDIALSRYGCAYTFGGSFDDFDNEFPVM